MVREKYEYWLNHPDLDPALKAELLTMDQKAIEDAFYTDVKFQTAGMRGLMGVGTNRINIHTVRKATMGFINYLLKTKKKAKVAISYDNRHHSQEFAYDCAELLATYRIESYIVPSLRPTPELSFAVRYYHCDGGIMITASHNPKEYNGYKLYDAEGCQLVPELAEQVIAEIEKLDDILAIKPQLAADKAAYIHKTGADLDRAYYDAVLSIRLNPALPKDFKIAFSPEHGASNWPVRNVLKEAGYSLVAVEAQSVPDPDFAATKTPNPEEKGAYEAVLHLAEAIKAELILVCDPDGDRMGVGVLHQGAYRILNGNQTGALLLEYILHSLSEKKALPANPVMFNTIVTSDIGEAVAKSYGVKTEKTLTGFKYIGARIARDEKSKTQNYVFGYEESYGSLIKPFVRDKDATQACLLLAEACAYYRQQNKTLQDVLEDIYERLGAYYDSQLAIALPGAEGAAKLKELLRKVRNEPLKEIAGIKVSFYEDYAAQKVYTAEGIKELKGFDKTDVLKYYFTDGSFLAVRPSGTEPKCKIYFSIKADTFAQAEAKNAQFRAYMQDFMR